MHDLAGKTAIVTGASRGLGAHIARALGAERMNLILAARSKGDLELVASQARRNGSRVLVAPTDVTRKGELEALVKLADQELGGVDVLVNNAGVDTWRPFHTTPFEDIDQMIELNVRAPLYLTRMILPGMLARGRGHVVNISSLAGKMGPPLAEAYGASKAALIAFTQSLRQSYHDKGVSASVVCPGYIRGEGMFARVQHETGVVPPRLVGTSAPEEVGAAVVRAVLEDLPEVLVSPGPKRLLFALAQAAPRLPEWLARRMKLRESYEQAARARGQLDE